jgi:hypothetical protein
MTRRQYFVGESAIAALLSLDPITEYLWARRTGNQFLGDGRQVADIDDAVGG